MKNEKGDIIVGAFDDLLFNPESQEYALLDYKTKGSAPDQEYCEKYYQTQMDIYTRFLELGNKKVANFGVLLYFWPVVAEDNLIDFMQQPFFLEPNTDNAEKNTIELKITEIFLNHLFFHISCTYFTLVR